MQISTELVVPLCVAGTFIIALFNTIRGYVKGINQELVDMRVRDAQYKAIIDNHIIQFRDIWLKLSEIDKHLENTDKNLSTLNERTKNIGAGHPL